MTRMDWILLKASSVFICGWVGWVRGSQASDRTVYILYVKILIASLFRSVRLL